MKRLLLLAIVAIALAPGTWFRSAPKPVSYEPELFVAKLDVEPRRVGSFRLAGVWELDSENGHFGSYSALVALDDGLLLAGSDRGRLLRFAEPDLPARAPYFAQASGDTQSDKELVDLESLTRDPATGRMWAGYESANAIERVDAAFRNPKRVLPEAMRNWAENAGPETLVRLADGRFIAMEEGRMFRGGPYEALLFPSDPAEGVEPLQFTFKAPDGYRPVDAAQLPDGRVLVLTRKVEWGVPPGFSARIVLADPAEIAEGEEWSGEVVATLAEPIPSDNWEGMAIVPGAEDAPPTIWLISDDNNALIQRTLLMKLLWEPEAASAASKTD